MKDLELRLIQATELRSDVEKRTVSGYGIVYNSPSQDLGGFKEIILPGAATDAFAQGVDVRLLVDHSMQKLLGRTASKSLALSDEPTGLRFECSVPDTSYGNDLLALMARGDVGKCSFGFTVPDGGDNWQNTGGQVIRSISKLNLQEVSILTGYDPAYAQTSVSLRASELAKDFGTRAENKISTLRRSLTLLHLKG